MPYLTDLEAAGIPTVLIDLAEETNKVKHDALVYGVPGMRYVEASRTMHGVPDVDRILPSVMDALVCPLTDEEKKSGTWAPKEPRILFEGTLEEAEEFYNQTENIPGILNAPFARYTDGLPVVIPTEERVERMLKGTSHKPDEIIKLQRDTYLRGIGEVNPGGTRKKGEPVRYMPMGRIATVEQVAVNAVMAGCKPEYMPWYSLSLNQAAEPETGAATADLFLSAAPSTRKSA